MNGIFPRLKGEVKEALFKLYLSILDDITKIPRTSSTGTMSSDEDPDEKDGNVSSFETPSKICRYSSFGPTVETQLGCFCHVGFF